MNQKHTISLSIIVIVLATLACSINDITGSSQSPEPTVGLETAVAQSLQQTAALQTAVSQSVAGTLAPNIQVTQTQVLLTATLGTTPTNTVSPTPEAAYVTVSEATNCRTGPGKVYDWVGFLNVGQEAEVIAKDPANSSLYIRNPNNPSGFCWIDNIHATVTGDIGSLQVFTPMPTPTIAVTATPSLDFTFQFSATEVCSGGDQFVEYTITNTGGLTIESYRLTVEGMGFWNDNQFVDYTGCAAGFTQGDLIPGETGHVSSKFINPNNVARTITFYVCSGNDLTGTCVTKTTIYTP